LYLKKFNNLTEATPSQYASLLIEIKERIRSAQLRALRQVESELLALDEETVRTGGT
jgi:hypothetical protein